MPVRGNQLQQSKRYRLCGKRTRICMTCGEHRRKHGPGQEIESHPFLPKPCEQPAMENGCCKMHGGHALRGIAHQNFQGKGFSKAVVLPARMLADYNAARMDPARLSLEDEIAELRTLRKDIWRMLEYDAHLATAAVKAAAQDIHKAYSQAFMAHRSGNAEKFAEAMNALGEAEKDLQHALGPVAAMEAARAQAADLAVKVEKLLRTENNRIIEERGMVSLEAALADRHTLVVALLGAVGKHVRDTEIQKAIRRTVGTEYARLTGRRDPPPAAAAGGDHIIDVEHSETVDGPGAAGPDGVLPRGSHPE